MDNSIKIEGFLYQLAASVTGGHVAIYGQSLDEVCQFYEGSVKRMKSPDLKAIERGKYAQFMLGQIDHFYSYDHVRILNRIILLCDCAIDTLVNMDSKDKQALYAQHITICRKCRDNAVELLSTKKQSK